MFHKTKLTAILVVLIATTLACGLPSKATQPAPAIDANPAPTDAGFAPPTQPAGAEPTQPVAPQAPEAGGQQGAAPGADAPRLTVATTSNLVRSGLLNPILSGFMVQSGYQIVLEEGGSGRAFKLGEKAVADVLLVNDPGTEKEFIAQGYGRDRILVMHTDYVLLGPADDPAKVKGSATIVEAFKKIATAQAKFVTKGDDSPTVMLENRFWKAAGITPSGDWFMKSPEATMGTIGVVKLASDKGAYTLTARSIFLEARTKNELKIDVVFEGDSQMFDNYHVITGNPDKSTKINYEGALAFAQYLTSPEIQALIAAFGQDTLGGQVYFPDAGN